MSNSSSDGRSSKGERVRVGLIGLTVVVRAAGAVTAGLVRYDMLSNEFQIMEKESSTAKGIGY